MRFGHNRNSLAQASSPVKQRKSCAKSNTKHHQDNNNNNDNNILINKINKIRNFSELNSNQQQQQQNYPSLNLATLAAGIEQPCSKANDGGTPEVAANAMVNMVRLILLILICVLLVKLRAPARKRNQKGRPRNQYESDSQYKYQQIDNLGDELSNNKQQLEAKDNLNKIPISDSIYSTNQQSPRRKISQPELLSESLSRQQKQQQQQGNTSEQQQFERRRRHSDSGLAHLKLPPGPMGLPFLGYLPFVGTEIHLTLTSLSERYGPIYQIFLGGIRVVVLNDASLVRQAFKQPVFSGRPDTQLTRILQGYGIVNSDGALWKEQRAFLHTALRKLGAKSLMNGSNGLESKIQVSGCYYHPLIIFVCLFLS